MTEQLIDAETGAFTFGNGFVVSHRTTVSDLIAHFAEQGLSVQDFKNGYSNYSIRNVKLGELYFIFTFYFLNGHITKTEFLVQAEPYDREASWDNFDKDAETAKGKFMERLMAKQMQGNDKKRGWGSAGVSYDFHNISSSCFIAYEPTPGM